MIVCPCWPSTLLHISSRATADIKVFWVSQARALVQRSIQSLDRAAQRWPQLDKFALKITPMVPLPVILSLFYRTTGGTDTCTSNLSLCTTAKVIYAHPALAQTPFSVCRRSSTGRSMNAIAAEQRKHPNGVGGRMAYGRFVMPVGYFTQN